MIDKQLAQRRRQGYAAFNEWELQEKHQKLPRLTVEQSVRQFLHLCHLARQLAPDAQRVFAKVNIAYRVGMRTRFRRIAEVMAATTPCAKG